MAYGATAYTPPIDTAINSGVDACADLQSVLCRSSLGACGPL